MRGEVPAQAGRSLRLWLAVGGGDDLVGRRVPGKVLLRRALRRGNRGVHACGAAVGCCGGRWRSDETDGDATDQAACADTGHALARDDTADFHDLPFEFRT